eukprot:m.84331 g.84331  ORF g.84331 m.84331 type:complete len:739 (-) comp12744_c0_seq3:2412-4628(-)
MPCLAFCQQHGTQVEPADEAGPDTVQGLGQRGKHIRVHHGTRRPSLSLATRTLSRSAATAQPTTSVSQHQHSHQHSAAHKHTVWSASREPEDTMHRRSWSSSTPNVWGPESLLTSTVTYATSAPSSSSPSVMSSPRGSPQPMGQPSSVQQPLPLTPQTALGQANITHNATHQPKPKPKPKPKPSRPLSGPIDADHLPAPCATLPQQHVPSHQTWGVSTTGALRPSQRDTRGASPSHRLSGSQPTLLPPTSPTTSTAPTVATMPDQSATAFTTGTVHTLPTSQAKSPKPQHAMIPAAKTRNAYTWMQHGQDRAAVAEPWPAGRKGAACCTINDRLLFVFGGYTRKMTNELWVFDTMCEEWREIKPPTRGERRAWPDASEGHTLSAIDDDRLMLYGGFTTLHYQELWIFTICTEKWNRVDASTAAAFSILAKPKPSSQLPSKPSTSSLAPRSRLSLKAESTAIQWPTPRYGHSASVWKTTHASVLETNMDEAAQSHNAQRVSIVIAGGTVHTTQRDVSEVWAFNAKLFEWDCLTMGHLSPAEPRARQHHSACVAGNYLFIYGGRCSKTGSLIGDLWRFHLLERTWTQLSMPHVTPSPRFGAAFAVVPGNTMSQHLSYDDSLDASVESSRSTDATVSKPWLAKLVLFGGQSKSADLGDVWVMTVRAKDASVKWQCTNQLRKKKTPPSRFRSTASLVNDCVYLFGGGSGKRVVLGDLWSLNLKEQHARAAKRVLKVQPSVKS